jgi:energy-coupling factor transporter ATP-binding protein EcfA2
LKNSEISETGAAAETSFVDLPKGEALEQFQASEIACQEVTRLVILAGPHGSGKTTILTALFEAFLEAPFANYLFAGSRTLVGFERRCHDARVASGRVEPHTVHTQVEAIDFLHLRLAPASGGSLGTQSLLLSDISGERFRALRDSTAAVQKMTVLKRADDLCVVLDGEKLATPDLRHAARNDARALLRSLIEARALSPDCKIEIVFAKWDAVMADAEQEASRLFIADTKTILRDLLRGTAEPDFFEVAARPKNIRVPFALGLPTLFRSWLKEPSTSRTKLYVPSVHRDVREAARFAESVVRNQQLGEFYDVQWV